jgi:CBS domain containing-hemolysin-like protein
MAHPEVLVLVLAFCVVLSFLCSGMEAGVFALNRFRVRNLVRHGRHRARLLQGYLEHPEDFLWTILVGNALANFAAIGLVVVVLHHGCRDRPPWFAAAFVTWCFLFYAVCDLLPKMLFQLYPDRLCMAAVVPFRLLHDLLSPIVALMAWLSKFMLRWTGGRVFTSHLFGSRDELRSVMQESDSTLTSEERVMISRVLDLPNITLRQVMVPMNKVLSASTTTTVSKLLEELRRQPHEQVPIWEEKTGTRRIIGTVSLHTMLTVAGDLPTKTVGDFVRPALYLEENVRLDGALRRLQRSGERLAIVLGHDRRELGIVALQDMLQTIFGEVNL